LNEVFKIGKIIYTSSIIGRGGLFKFQTYIQRKRQGAFGCGVL
jgi:hypothetical protein